VLKRHHTPPLYAHSPPTPPHPTPATVIRGVHIRRPWRGAGHVQHRRLHQGLCQGEREALAVFVGGRGRGVAGGCVVGAPHVSGLHFSLSFCMRLAGFLCATLQNHSAHTTPHPHPPTRTRKRSRALSLRWPSAGPSTCQPRTPSSRSTTAASS